MAAAAIPVVAGAVIQAWGAKQSGDASAAAGQFAQAQARINAGQDIAAGSAAVADQVRQTKLVQSHAIAVAAASGAGALDPTVVNIVSGIAKVGEYNEGMTKYNAESRAQAEIAGGNADALTGQARQRASNISAAGTILSGVGTAWGHS